MVFVVKVREYLDSVQFTPVSDAQREFLRDRRHRVVVALGGQGSGKTHMAVLKTIDIVTEYPGSQVMWVAPDLERLEAGLLTKWRELCPPGLMESMFLQRRLIKLVNASGIHWRSSDIPGGLRAGEYNLGVFDEAGWAPNPQARRAVSDLRARLRLTQSEVECPNEWVPDRPWVEVLERGKAKSRLRVKYGQQMAITSTPRYGSYLNEYLEVPPEGVAIYSFRTEDNIEHLPPEYMDELRAAYASDTLFRQEALGELVGVESADYPTFDPRVHVMAGPAEYRLVVGGIDWGWRNKLAIVVVGFTSTGTAFGIEEWGGSHITLDNMAIAADQIMRRRGVHVFFCDKSEPQSIRFLNDKGVASVKQSVIDRVYRMAAVASRFERTPLGTYRLYLAPSMRETIRELRFAGQTVEDPRKIKEARAGQPGDDFVDALGYAITGGERMLGHPMAPTIARGQKRHEGLRPSSGVPFRLI